MKKIKEEIYTFLKFPYFKVSWAKLVSIYSNSFTTSAQTHLSYVIFIKP